MPFLFFALARLAAIVVILLGGSLLATGHPLWGVVVGAMGIAYWWWDGRHNPYPKALEEGSNQLGIISAESAAAKTDDSSWPSEPSLGFWDWLAGSIAFWGLPSVFILLLALTYCN